MILGEWELAGLNSVSGGGRLPGVALSVPPPDDRLAGESVAAGLETKGVVGDDGRLTAFGMAAVRVVEEYRTAARHVFMNQMRIGVNADRSLAVLHPVPGGWSVARVAPAAMLVAVLKAFPFLRLGSVLGPEPGPWRPMALGEWAALQGRDPNGRVLVVRRLPRGERDGVAYSAPGGVGQAFDVGSGLVRSMPVPDIRVLVAGLLGCAADGEVSEHG
ncbi:MAG: hypothetical protein LBK42_07650 [Propionibacteriaceae bacterium]|nr:hypothetical protein [Propionibacteriaceae bacterium]